MEPGTAEPRGEQFLREQIPAALDGDRLDRVVAMIADTSRSMAARLVVDGMVTVDDVAVTVRSTRVEAEQWVAVTVPEEEDKRVVITGETVDLTVLYEDEHVVVVNKPAGMVVHPGAGAETATVAHGLLARYPEVAQVGEPDRPGIVHRLDRGTSGALVTARSAEAHELLVEALSHREVTREYLAVAWGLIDNDRGTVDAPIGRSTKRRTRMTVLDSGREARTHYEVLARSDGERPTTLLRCRLETGRTHQIRVHLQAIGHPIVGDDVYGGMRGDSPFVKASAHAGRPALHARRLRFTHPLTGAVVDQVAPLPEDLAGLIRDLFDLEADLL